MDQTDYQQNAMTREEALKHVEQLRADVAEVRSRLTPQANAATNYFTSDQHKLVEKSVEKIADQAGTMVGASIAIAKRIFKRRLA